MKNGRRKFSGEEKMSILRRHLVEKMPVSDVCDKAGINPTLFYRWQKDLFEHGAAAFGRRGDDGQNRRLEEKVAALERKLEASKASECEFVGVAGDVITLAGLVLGFPDGSHDD